MAEMRPTGPSLVPFPGFRWVPRQLAQALGFSQAEVRGCELLRVHGPLAQTRGVSRDGPHQVHRASHHHFRLPHGGPWARSDENISQDTQYITVLLVHYADTKTRLSLGIGRRRGLESVSLYNQLVLLHLHPCCGRAAVRRSD